MSYIYVISNGNHYKIGFSKNPEKRVKQLQTGNSHKLELVYMVHFVIAPIRIIEKIAHRQFPNKIFGEWYAGNIEDIKHTLNFIKIRYDNENTEVEYQQGTLNYFC